MWEGVGSWAVPRGLGSPRKARGARWAAVRRRGMAGGKAVWRFLGSPVRREGRRRQAATLQNPQAITAERAEDSQPAEQPTTKPTTKDTTDTKENSSFRFRGSKNRDPFVSFVPSVVTLVVQGFEVSSAPSPISAVRSLFLPVTLLPAAGGGNRIRARGLG